MIRIVPLDESHNYKGFDCTEEWMTEEKDLADAAEMNTFLIQRALKQAKNGISKTFVVLDIESEQPDRVIAYYATNTGHLTSEALPKLVSQRMTIPIINLLRLAVDKNWQRRRLGKRLFAHILSQSVRVAHDTGVHAIVLEPLNERVRGFYNKFGMKELPDASGLMYLTIREASTWLQANKTQE